MTDREITERIIRDVMGWGCIARGVPFPNMKEDEVIAFFHSKFEQWCYYTEKHKTPTPFDPLHNMNDAWMVVEKINSTPNWYTGKLTNALLNVLEVEAGEGEFNAIEALLLEKEPARAICMAALATVEKMNESVTP